MTGVHNTAEESSHAGGLMSGIATQARTRVRDWRHRASDMLFGGNRSTIDTIRMAPPPSPLAPVDLTDPLAIHRVTDVAARVGDLLLCSGTGNSDAKAQILAVTDRKSVV